MEAVIITGMSILTTRDVTWMAPSMAAMPNTSRTLAMLEPMMLPTASSVSSAATAWPTTASSGAEVPAATMVSPITIGLRPNRAPRPDAARTTRWPATSRASRPPVNSASALIGGRG